MGICERCECHSHASQCDKEYGACIGCQHNTEGDRCERCKPGFTGDARRGTPHDCLPVEQPARPSCQCYNHSPRGCDSYGRCIQCEHNTEGFHCEVCKKGYYGQAIRGTPFDCTACPCPGDRECFLDERGQVQCKNCPPGYSGGRCDECAPGYTRSQTGGGRECEPIGRHRPSEVDFVPAPEGQKFLQSPTTYRPTSYRGGMTRRGSIRIGGGGGGGGSGGRRPHGRRYRVQSRLQGGQRPPTRLRFILK
uniref:Laminin EGF-like domain-containing protein n=1 Tax=Meloidogyne hapla TaxID=6305 RepID=A0A1I8BEK1_MELHA